MNKNRLPILFLIILMFTVLNISAFADETDDALIHPAFFDLQTGEGGSLSLPGRAGSISAPSRSILFPETIKSAAPAMKIIGSDDRTHIYSSPTNVPYSAVARIWTEYGVCSGFMIGPHYAVTSASCIYDKSRRFSSKVQACPGYADGASSCGCEYASYMWVMDTDLQKQFNVAVLKFDSNLGHCSGWLGYKQIQDRDAFNWVTLIAYDNDAGMKYMYYTSGNLKGTYANGTMLQYDLDTGRGTWGAPVIMNNEYVVAVDYGYNSDHNIGVRLTNKVMNFLKPYWGK